MLCLLFLVMVETRPKAVVFKVTPVGEIKENIIETSTELFLSSLHDVRKFDLIFVKDYCDDVEKALAVAKEKGAQKAIYAKLSQLTEKKYILMLYKVDVNKGVEFTDQIPFHIYSLDVVMKRAGISVSYNTKFYSTVRIGAITSRELIREKIRKGAFKSSGVYVGSLIPIAGYSNVEDILTEFGISILAEAMKYSANVDFSFSAANNLTMMGVDIGVMKYNKPQSDNSTIMGFNIGIRGITYEIGEWERESTSGLSLSAFIGYSMFRFYDFRVLMQLGYNFVYANFGGEYYHDGVFVKMGTVLGKSSFFGTDDDVVKIASVVVAPIVGCLMLSILTSAE